MNRGNEQEAIGLRPGTVALERETAAPRIKVPQVLKALEPDLQKASARIRACGLEDPFRDDRLRELPPRTVRAAVEEARKAGMLAEGPGWAVRQDQVQALAESLHKTFQRQLDLDRDLPGISRGI